MNTPTPIPTLRTDAATYPADCLGATLVTNRDLARTLERELAAERARLDWLEANGFLLDEITHGAFRAHPDDYWICTDGERTGEGATPRAAIDAAMKEDAK